MDGGAILDVKPQRGRRWSETDALAFRVQRDRTLFPRLATRLRPTLVSTARACQSGRGFEDDFQEVLVALAVAVDKWDSVRCGFLPFWSVHARNCVSRWRRWAAYQMRRPSVPDAEFVDEHAQSVGAAGFSVASVSIEVGLKRSFSALRVGDDGLGPHRRLVAFVTEFEGFRGQDAARAVRLAERLVVEALYIASAVGELPPGRLWQLAGEVLQAEAGPNLLAQEDGRN